SNFFPQISANLSYNETLNSTDEGPQPEYAVGLTATENLFSGFQDSARVSQSKAQLTLARVAYQNVKAKVSSDLKSALARLQFAQSYIQLSRSIIERRELNLKTVRLRFTSGRENRGSVLLSQAYLEDARLEYLKA